MMVSDCKVSGFAQRLILTEEADGRECFVLCHSLHASKGFWLAACIPKLASALFMHKGFASSKTD